MEAPQVVDASAVPDLLHLIGEYRRREPEKTVLYQVILENYRTFAAQSEAVERPLPAFVRREFERYLACGQLSEGLARVHCGKCGYDRLVAFSCKRRGWCPSCIGRRMNDGAAFLVDHVWGDTPVRQWVLSLPHPLRYILAYDAALLSAVLSIFIQCVFRFLRWKAKTELGLPSVTMAFPGSVTSIQRSSSHLSLNIHFHALVTDGVFVQEDPGGEVQFHALTPPTDDEITAVAQDICCKTIELLKNKGIWKDHESDTEDTFASQEPALAHAYSASVRGVLSTGPRSGQRVVRFFGAAAQGEPEGAKRSTNAFDLHARRATFAYDRDAVERLARYILRPPVAQDSLERLDDGRIALRLKRAWKDGTTAVVFEPLDLMSKLTALIPRPRTNVIRFHGVYAPNAKLRSQVLPAPPTQDACGHPIEPDPKQKGLRLKWAQLLARVFQVSNEAALRFFLPAMLG